MTDASYTHFGWKEKNEAAPSCPSETENPHCQEREKTSKGAAFSRKLSPGASSVVGEAQLCANLFTVANLFTLLAMALVLKKSDTHTRCRETEPKGPSCLLETTLHRIIALLLPWAVSE